jgi:hypothetical protein
LSFPEDPALSEVEWGCAVVFPPSDSQNGKAKNKVQKVGVFSAAQKSPRKTPQSRRIPPQIQHAFTTRKHSKNARPPAKATLFPPNIFLQKQHPH